MFIILIQSTSIPRFKYKRLTWLGHVLGFMVTGSLDRPLTGNQEGAGDAGDLAQDKDLVEANLT